MADIVALGNGAYHVVDERHSRVGYAVASKQSCWVFLDGRVYLVEPPASDTAVRTRRRGDDHTVLSAPMPATVVAIAVEAGQRVESGDVLIVLEAMKMELPIKAPRDGIVRTIACSPGELVQPGVQLVELE